MTLCIRKEDFEGIMSILSRSSGEVIFLCFLVMSLHVLSEAHFLEHLMRQLQPRPAHGDQCKPHCCQGKRCPMPKCRPNQAMKRHAGWCGCCPKCVTQLKMGATCRPKPKHPCPQMPSSECGCGLKCVRGKCCK